MWEGEVGGACGIIHILLLHFVYMYLAGTVCLNDTWLLNLFPLTSNYLSSNMLAPGVIAHARSHCFPINMITFLK